MFFDLAKHLTENLFKACPEIKRQYSKVDIESVLWWGLMDADSYMPSNDNTQLDLFIQQDLLF